MLAAFSFECLLAPPATDGEGTREQPRCQNRLAAIDALPVAAGLDETHGLLDLLDLQRAHLEEGDVEPALELLNGALFLVGYGDRLPGQRLAERAALLSQDLYLCAKQAQQSRMPLRPSIVISEAPPRPRPAATPELPLIETLKAAYNIDGARIYADGLSNGGGMAFVLPARCPTGSRQSGWWRQLNCCRSTGARTNERFR